MAKNGQISQNSQNNKKLKKVKKMVENNQKMVKKWLRIVKIVKMVKLVKMVKNGYKCQIYKVQYRSLQMSSSIRLLGGDSMFLSLPSNKM